MKPDYKNCINVLVWIFITIICSRQCFADPNTNCLVKLEQESQKIVYLTESVYWPDFDFKNVKQYIAEPNSKKKADFVRMVSQIIEPNYLPQELDKKIICLKGWRGDANENFMLQYEKSPYLIRIKNQTTTVIASRKWISYWFTVVIEIESKSECVNKTDPNSIFKFTDQFLRRKVNSKAQDYSSIKNMDGTQMKSARFQKLGANNLLAYPVSASHPDIDFVSIWTDGNTVIINLKERRKELY